MDLKVEFENQLSEIEREIFRKSDTAYYIGYSEFLEQRIEAGHQGTVVSVPYQCCPVCHGTGEVLLDGFSSAVCKTCDVCDGRKIIPEAIIPQAKKRRVNLTDGV